MRSRKGSMPAVKGVIVVMVDVDVMVVFLWWWWWSVVVRHEEEGIICQCRFNEWACR